MTFLSGRLHRPLFCVYYCNRYSTKPSNDMTMKEKKNYVSQLNVRRVMMKKT